MRRLSWILACLIALSVTAGEAQQNATQSQGAEFVAAVVTEQNVTFAVVIVKYSVFSDKNLADKLIQSFEPAFGGVPVILMGQDENATPYYYGRQDIVQFLANVPLKSIPWKRYSLTNK